MVSNLPRSFSRRQILWMNSNLWTRGPLFPNWAFRSLRSCISRSSWVVLSTSNLRALPTCTQSKPGTLSLTIPWQERPTGNWRSTTVTAAILSSRLSILECKVKRTLEMRLWTPLQTLPTLKRARSVCSKWLRHRRRSFPQIWCARAARLPVPWLTTHQW